MKKLLILSLLIAGMLSEFSCSDNNTSIEELPAPAEVTTTAETTAKEKKVYDYVHGQDGYYNIADEMTEFEMKSQKYGTCWLYAAAASMETAYFKENGSYISIDPLLLLDITYLDEKDEGFFVKEGIDGKELGGSQPIVTFSLSDGFDDLVLDSSVILDADDREAIKENIRKRGAVAIGILDSDNSKKGWFGTYRTINYTKKDNFDHDVTIIGYDDHFPKEYFKETASEDGAWITYNSSLGSVCYYYISYSAPLEYAISHSVTDKYGEVLSYDAGTEQDRYVRTGDITKTANVFHKEGKLAAVGTYNDFDEQDIKIEIYDAGIQNLLYSQDAKLDYHGYHTIELDTALDVTDYAIVINYTKGAPVEGEDVDYGELEYKTVSEKGQSFVYAGNVWNDVVNSDIKAVLKIDFEPNNCCIKAIYK
ncbi:lectin like domain-containing protein [Ruminococcus flavefaciens]|uniref:lectin like domain-containing protein n=1 Tax=Ruminococcus flavefaciens TaxID=1265 RepID=UPI00030DBC18|nr:lectin like domain-containing protein [Ruminococcus flavefaciens]